MNNSNNLTINAPKVEAQSFNDASFISGGTTTPVLEVNISQPLNEDQIDEKQSAKMTKAARMGKTTGRWTREEHKKFLEGKISLVLTLSGLKMFGKNWKKVEGYIKTRTGTQIRSHA